MKVKSQQSKKHQFWLKHRKARCPALMATFISTIPNNNGPNIQYNYFKKTQSYLCLKNEKHE